MAEWLDGLDKKTRNYLQDKLDLLHLHGLILLNTNIMRPLKGYGGHFYEIKFSSYRIVLSHDIRNNIFMVLHGFKKKHQRETMEIEKAYSRLRDYNYRGQG